MKDISCIIINFNTSTFTLNCIQSILESHNDLENYEIIVVDNASKKEDFEKLQAGIDTIGADNLKLIRSKQNQGFGGGNMLGVQNCTSCKYYAFINNDTLIHDKNTFTRLEQFLSDNPEVAVCSPQMLDENGNFRVTIDHFSSLAREILRRPLMEFLFPKKYLNRKIFYDEPTKVDYIQGSFMFVRAKDFNEIGGFDTNLFLYYEESDLCQRLLKRLNKFTYLIPDVTYVHFKGASTEKSVTMKIELKLSLLYNMRKQYGFWAYKTLLTYLQLRYFCTSLVKPKYFPLLKALMKGAHISNSLKQKQPIIE